MSAFESGCLIAPPEKQTIGIPAYICLSKTVTDGHYNSDYLIGLDLASHGNPAGGEAFLRDNYAKNSGDFEALRSLVLCLIDQRKRQEALMIAKQFAATRPRYVNAIALVGSIYAALGETRQSSQTYDEALALSEDFPDALVGKASLYIGSKKNASLVDQLWSKVPRSYQTLDAERVRLDVMLRLEGMDAALNHVRGLESRLRESRPGRRYLARYYSQIGAHQDALRFADRDSDYTTPFERHDRIDIYIRAGENHLALRALSEDQDRENWYYWYKVGRAKFGLEDVGGGMEAMQRSISYQPKLPNPYFDLATAFSKAGQFEEALGCAYAGFAIFPESSVMYTMAVRLSIRQRKFIAMFGVIWRRLRALRHAIGQK